LRPAANLRRRSFVFLVTAATLASAFTLRPSPPPPPEFERAAIQRSTRKTLMAVRPDQPETARRIERLLGEAQRIQAYETAASSWDRSEGRAEEAWLRVLRANTHARQTHWNQTTAAKRRWDALSPRLALELKEAQTQLAQGGGLGYREAKALRGALYHRDLALRQARNGDLGDAADHAEEALGLVGVVDKGYAALHSRFEDPRARRQWTSWVAETIEQSRQTGGVAILVDKLARKLEVYDGGKRIATYVAELGANGLKQKRHAGDRATPEGRYRITEVRGTNATKFYKALMLNYPNGEDRARFEFAKRRGEIPQRAGIGSLIEIHGEGGEGKDWTDGCVALRNRDMDSLFRYARVGTPVTIVGTSSR
jgi:L,D-peptidoglycan transpeptidase YkuD (ErfK/YbiS/YcfS/YnhG family)